jgi:hypothetical protein
VRWLNVGFVLLFAHQLGHARGDGTMTRWPRRAFWAMVAIGLAGLLILTNPWVFRPFGDVRFTWFPGISHYPKSLPGTDGLTAWLGRRRPWAVTIAVNSVIMTLFLWHMTAYLLTILALWPLGFGHESDSTPRWWLERPLWEFVPAAILLP